MYQTIGFNDFYDAFQKTRPENFSYQGLKVLYDYLEEMDGGTELDVIAFCCEFSEDKIKDVLSDYNLESLEELEQNTIVLTVDDDTIIYQNY